MLTAFAEEEEEEEETGSIPFRPQRRYMPHHRDAGKTFVCQTMFVIGMTAPHKEEAPSSLLVIEIVR